LDDADLIRGKILLAFERAEEMAALDHADTERIRQLLTFVLVGEGAASSRELGHEDLHEHASDQCGCRRSRGGRPARSVEHGAVGSRSAGITSRALGWGGGGYVRAKPPRVRT